MSIWPLDPPHSYYTNPIQDTQLVFAIGGTQLNGTSTSLNDSVYEIDPDSWDQRYGSNAQGWASKTGLPPNGLEQCHFEQPGLCLWRIGGFRTMGNS